MCKINRCSTTFVRDHLRRSTLTQVVPQITARLMVLALTLACWGRQPVAIASSPQSPPYEVATVKPSAPDRSGAGRIAISGDRFLARNFSVQQMVYIAYDINSSDLISNLPQWTSSLRYDVQAKLGDDKEHKTEDERSQVVMQALLADRFQLKSHYETRVRHAYALIADKHGLKVQEATAADQLEISVLRGNIHLRDAAMPPFVQGLSLMVGRPVIDKTKLTGRYNIDLTFSPDELNSTGDTRPTMYTALREQLGLRLVPTKTPIDVLVIDRLERPSAN